MDENRREVIKKLVYIAPLIISLSVRPSFAKSGSDSTYKKQHNNNGVNWWSKLLGDERQ